MVSGVSIAASRQRVYLVLVLVVTFCSNYASGAVICPVDSNTSCRGAGSVARQQTQIEKVEYAGDAASKVDSFQGSSNCLLLANRGSHFTVELEVGTPPQGPFSVLADTGSNSLIIQGCICQVSGRCVFDKPGHCFEGIGKSTSFSLFTENGEVKPQPGKRANPLQLRMSFGSGTIDGIVAKDVVRIGGFNLTMAEGFIEMVDQGLAIRGPTIEGILGLGLPSQAQAKSTSGLLMYGGEGLENQPKVNSFLEQANISRFSLCFGPRGDGALQLDAAMASKPLGSYGTLHWGLGVDGISVAGAEVGATPLHLELCTAASMRSGQETPCGIIPDSGTTMITGLSEHFAVIKAALCDAWPRCRRAIAHSVDPDMQTVSQRTLYQEPNAQVFDKMLEDCSSWLNSSEEGVAELPALQFHVTGRGGERETLSLPGSAYILENQQSSIQVEYQDIPGRGRIPVRKTQIFRTACAAAFQYMPYKTVKNGPVFILGLPLFYKYRVHYDLHAAPPAMAFTSLDEQPCGSCRLDGHILGMAETSARQQQRWPRRVASLDGRTSIDHSLPM